MRSWGLTIARLSLTAWVGAAVFFVVVAIRPIRAPEFDTPHRALLASLLFPGYYAFGFTLLGLGGISTVVARPHRWIWQIACVALALGLATVDWFLIYGPLAEMTHKQWTEQAAASASFRDYHIASMVINGIGLLFSLGAAVLSCLPSESPDPTQNR